MRHSSWIFGLLLLSLAMLTTGAAASPATMPAIPETHDEEEIGSADPLESLARYLLDKSGRVQGEAAEEPWQRLLRNEAFSAFLRSNGLADGSRLARNERYPQVAAFLRESLRPFSDPLFLETRQRESMARSLFFRRDPIREPGLFAADGYRTLHEISARNRVRVSRLLPAVTEKNEVRELVQKLSVVFIHNTHVIRSVPDTPLVSSRVLQEVSGIGGLNTYYFNRQFLHSDDNIFFFVLLQSGPKLGNARESLYGKYKFAPEETFGRERGWVSAFVMYPYDLYRFAFGSEKTLADQLTPAFQREFPREMTTSGGDLQSLVKSLRPYKRDNPRWNRMLRDSFPLWRPVRRRLGQLDFTVDDFRALTLQVIEAYLAGISTAEPARFAEWKSRLEQGDTGDLMRLAYKEICGLDLYFEFKVPVAIPPWGLREIE
ncbi:MAG TPA: hypothetical protein PKO06_06040 [Candidatus Ozemobacteraceae bacterium]|nr:hypothetical protein [Candidatus Ozemobacteraceae bacterium]